MEPGDGFIAIPSVIAGEPEVGDVVTFRAEELHGGGLVTHRIVGRSQAGYITRGDANPFTDQSGTEPPVSEDQIVAVALEINNQIVVIPNLGDAVLGFQNIISSAVTAIGIGSLVGDGAQSLVWIGIGVIGIGFVADIVSSDRSSGRRTRRRSGYIKNTTFLLVLILVVLTPATASMIVPSGTTTFDIVSSESPGGNPLVVGVGQETSVEYQVSNGGYIPVLTVIESDSPSVSISQQVLFVPGKTERVTMLSIRAPDQTGVFTRSITQWQYLPILPRSIILGLHAIHPLIAVLTIDLVLLLGAVTAGLLAVGIGPIRFRSAGRDISTVQRIKRKMF